MTIQDRLRADDTSADDCFRAADVIDTLTDTIEKITEAAEATAVGLDQLRSKTQMLTNLSCKKSWLIGQLVAIGDLETDNDGQYIIYTGEYDPGYHG